MSMLTLHGIVKNVFQTPDGKDKEGNKFGGEHKVQILADNLLKNGETRCELVNLTVEDPAKFQSSINKEVSVPVGVFARAGQLYFFHQEKA